MKLFFRKSGNGQPMIILHGLFGQSDNWNSLARQFGDQGFEVYTVDQRNHGLSPHSEEWNYQVMSDDLDELISDNKLEDVILLGHSMGGKVVMLYAMQHPQKLDKIVVADMAPRYYAPHHQDVLEALNAVDFNIVKSRKEAEEIMSRYITDNGTRQFLLKNIYWKENGQLDWRFNLKVIAKNMEKAGAALPEEICEVPALFIRGERSNYITDKDYEQIRDLFPRSMLETIAGAGHWVHAEKPKDFFDAVMNFVK